MTAAPCSWPIDRTCLPPLPVLGDTPTTDEQAAYDAALATRNAAEDVAVGVLWALSGRQFGVCDTIARPCPNRGWYPAPWNRTLRETFPDSGLFVLLWTGDQWADVSCGCGGGRCHESGPRQVHLPGPAQAVNSVVVNGLALDESDYVLENDVLYRVGTMGWPTQDLGRPMGETNTWSVNYQRGVPPPQGTDKFVGLLARELILACNGETCRLPRNVASVARQGVSYQVYNPQLIYDNGKTNLPEVDMWLAAFNPHHLMAAPSVI